MVLTRGLWLRCITKLEYRLLVKSDGAVCFDPRFRVWRECEIIN